MEEKKPRAYMPITLSLDEAALEVRNTENGRELADSICAQLLNASVTPLQAQAILVRAWVRVQKNGFLSKSPHPAPSQTE